MREFYDQFAVLISQFDYKMMVISAGVAFTILLLLLSFLSYYFSPYFRGTHRLRIVHKFDKGAAGEYELYKELSKIHGRKLFLFNLYVPIGKNSTEIDMIMLHKSGIYVFESKNYSGTIYGDEYSTKWCQFFTQNNKYSFYNPISQNNTHIRALKKAIGEDSNYYNIVVFGNKCTLSFNKIQHDNIVVTQTKNITKAVIRLKRKGNHKTNIDDIYKILSEYQHSDRRTKRKHIRYVKKKKRSFL